MSVHAYVGLPGSGKSYNVVEHVILPALKEGRTVCTNLPLLEEAVTAAIPGADLRLVEIDRVKDNPGLMDELFPPGCVCVLDEVWRLWPAGQKVNNIPIEYKSFLAEHRHRVDAQGRSTQIVLVTQDLGQIAAFARQLIEQTLIHTKLGHLGAKGSFKVNIGHGAVTGTEVPVARQLVTRLGKYKPEVWRFYKSHTMSSSTKDGADESAVDQRGNIWKRPGLIGMAVLGLAGFGFGGKWVYDMSRDPGTTLSGKAAVGGEPLQPRPGTKQHVVGTLAPSAGAKRYRVSGHLISQDGRSMALVTDGAASAWISFDSYCRKERTGVACVVDGRRFTSGDLFP